MSKPQWTTEQYGWRFVVQRVHNPGTNCERVEIDGGVNEEGIALETFVDEHVAELRAEVLNRRGS